VYVVPYLNKCFSRPSPDRDWLAPSVHPILCVVLPVSDPHSRAIPNRGLSTHRSARLSGLNHTATARNVAGLFFPQSRSLGLDRGEASCAVLQKITYAGVMAGTSFRQGSLSLENLADLHVSAKQVERVVRRIGAERCDQRDAAVDAFMQLPLVEKSKAPPEVTPPDLAVVMTDGGRLQILERCTRADDTAKPAVNQPGAAGTDAVAASARAADSQAATSQDRPADSSASGTSGDPLPPLPHDAEEESDSPVREPGSTSKHWREDKVGILLDMSSPQNKDDPCPEIPRHFVEQKRIEKLTRELKARARGKVVPTSEPGPDDEAVAGDGPEAAKGKTVKDEEPSWDPPELKRRKVVATRRSWRCFGPILAAAAWSQGFFASPRKAFLGDGSTSVWGVWRRHFSTFVPILDFIHGLSYVYSAAMAGRSLVEGWEVYKRWIAWVWQGEVAKVIVAVRQRLQEVRLLDKESSALEVLQEALTFLENHKGQMKYNEYRRQGLPITTSHIESEIKRINLRVKGTEKFWSEEGAEYILQLRADYLSDDRPMDAFWQNRQIQESGQRRYRKHA
jgi:hypothetical protein